MKKQAFLFVLIYLYTSLCVLADDTKTLLMYSSRQEEWIKPICDKFEAETGIKIIIRTGTGPSLNEMLVREGEDTKADVLMTVDAGNLCYAASQDLLAPIQSEILEKNIPKHLRDEKNRWFGLSIRARTIVYSTERVKPTDLKGYADLADPKWKGRLVLRTSKKVYNQSLVAILIALNGEEKTEQIVSGWVKNLATDVLDSDTKVIDTIVAGTADVGIVNTYYFGRMIKEKPNLPVKLFWPDQDSTGVHVNVAGAAIIKYSKNKESAKKFLEWMTEKEAQKMLTSTNMEYPINPTMEPDDVVKSWGTFKQCDVPLSKAGDLQPQAIRLMKKANYK